jgi:hypothetical protein
MGQKLDSAAHKSKKNPQPSHGRLGTLPACTLHSLILEDLYVKNIQAGFLTLPTLTRLPILSLSKDSGFFVKALTPKIWGRDYSGGSVPDFLT